MAKGLRSSVIKRNKAKLRAEVFGPVVDRRTERLSAKLQALVAKPKEVNMDDADQLDVSKAGETEAGKEMDIDEQPGATKPSAENTGRIQKRVRRKTRPSITFAAHPQKAKRLHKKK
ncbi:ethanolaminephosphotransferase [[Emmonsia] crescens]|uniref:Ethanolaminephosphotransferase n=1 Tax=[Emmonsia] crescens TaxID=73230 RepID=A0A2B7ZF18_9EURO|nr:ethanolaminephosphotransferase [Emmonsia crescens]